MLRARRKHRRHDRSLELLQLMRPVPRSGIRRGDSADLPVIHTLLRAAGLPTADLTPDPGLSLWVLEGEPALQGVIALQRFGHEGLLRSLAIAPEQRRRGFGRELVVRLEQDAHAEGVERLILLTETAEMFFRALGYQSVDRHSVGHAVTQSAEFRSLCPATALCMSKALGS